MVISLVIAVAAIICFFLLIRSPNDCPSSAAAQINKESPLPTPGTAEWKGQIGEMSVKRILSCLPQDEYIVLNDVLLPTTCGTTQLDHIIVSLYGIFVIETKNYSGTLYGGESSNKWTQYLGEQKYVFHNPLLQNEGHVTALSKYTHVSRNCFIPLVVFTGNAKIKASVGKKAVYLNQLFYTIRQYHNTIFTAEQITYYARIIDNALEETDDAKRVHINSVKEIIDHRNLELSSGCCPQCDGYLVLRHGKDGDFWGCSNYPRCRYSMNIDSNN